MGGGIIWFQPNCFPMVGNGLVPLFGPLKHKTDLKLEKGIRRRQSNRLSKIRGAFDVLALLRIR